MKKYLIVIFVSVILLSGCSMRLSQVMINPQTGDKKTCAHWCRGWGLSYLAVREDIIQRQNECIERLKQAGYTEYGESIYR
jgi:hypothetical protein